jgi:hypothetical protein
MKPNTQDAYQNASTTIESVVNAERVAESDGLIMPKPKTSKKEVLVGR